MSSSVPKKLVLLYNQSPKDIGVYANGKRLTLPAFTELPFDDVTAALFMNQHPGLAVPAQDFSALSTTVVERPKTIWVANMTGNPDAPDKIKARVLDNRRWAVMDIDNPAKKPRALSAEMQGTWIEVPTAFGEVTTKRTPWKTIVVPPYKRVEMEAHIAKWFLQRTAIARFAHNPAEGEPMTLAIKARPPQDFEPDVSWPLDMLRAYLRYLDPDAPMPDSEDELRTKASKAKAKVDEVAFRIEMEKRTLLKRLFFYVVNPKGPKLPTRAQFEMFIDGPVARSSDVDADELLERADAEVAEMLAKAGKISDGDLNSIGG